MNNQNLITIILDKKELRKQQKTDTLKQILEKEKIYNKNSFYEVELDSQQILIPTLQLKKQIPDTVDTLLVKEISIEDIINQFNVQSIQNNQYANEFKRLNNEIKILQEENESLKHQLQYANKDVQNLYSEKRHYIKILTTIDNESQSQLFSSAIISQSQMKIQPKINISQIQTVNSEIMESQIQYDESAGMDQGHQEQNESQNSMLTSVSYNCYKCQMEIQENTIQLLCLHFFHYSCFCDMIKQQISGGKTVLHCSCGQNICSSLILQMSDILTSKILFNKLIENQLEKVQQSYANQILKCKQCEFFIFTKEQKEQESFCPICLKNTTFQVLT